MEFMITMEIQMKERTREREEDSRHERSDMCGIIHKSEIIRIRNGKNTKQTTN